MTNSDSLNDDEYVAKLLAEDARKSSLRYSSVGMSALLPKRPTGTAPRANTRFLKTLVREADSHNAALKKKEELEARIRLKTIREKEASQGPPRKRDSRGDRGGHDEGRATKRRRLSDDADSDHHHHHRSRSSRSINDPRRQRRRNSSSERSNSPEPSHRDRRGGRSSDTVDGASHRRHHKSSRRNRSRSPDKDREDDTRERERRPHHSRSHHPSSPKGGTRYPSSADRTRGDIQRINSPPPQSRRHRQRARSQSSISSTTSDPLASLIGPEPAQKLQGGSPTKRRGRGFHNPQPTSNIDHHFSATYNPSHDASASPDGSLDGDGDGEDWDNALEALRDRRAWRVKQADRMREAGFGDDEIDRWEKTAAKASSLGRGADGDVRDVKWRKQGEAKEWDQGRLSLDNTDSSHSRPKAKVAAGVDVWRRKDSGFMKEFRKALG